MRIVFACLALLLGACSSDPGPDLGYGANPQLAAPHGGLFPTINTARAIGWAQGAGPVAPEGYVVSRYAEQLDHPRWLYLLPNGDVLVAQSSTRPTRGGGLVGWIGNVMQVRAGAIEDQSPDSITLLRDSDADGVVDETYVFAEGLNQPFGMALVGSHLFIANTDKVLRFAYADGQTRLDGAGEVILDLPYNEGANGHWTRSLAVSPDGSKLYVAVGSVSNVPQNADALALEAGRAAVWEFNPDGGEARLYATGLRNPVGMEFEPYSGVLWVAVNERDMLGDNLVPDYMTSVQDGGFYGWPYYYFGAIRDERVDIPANVRLREPLAPDYALGSHTASLGLHFYTAQALGPAYQGGAFIGQHGSWNRSVRVGYKVVFVPFANGRPNGQVQDFLTGFLNQRGQAQGRPVGVITDRTGALLVADDVGDIIWRVAPSVRP